MDMNKNIKKDIKAKKKLVNEEAVFLEGLIVSTDQQLERHREAIRLLMYQKQLIQNIKKKVK